MHSEQQSSKLQISAKFLDNLKL